MEPVLPFELVIPDAGEGFRMQSLHQQLRAAILDGRLAAGLALPSTRRLAAALSLGRNTVIAAYDLLVAEGYVDAGPGRVARVQRLHPPARKTSRPIYGERRKLLVERWQQPPPTEPPRPLPLQSFRLGMPDHRYFPHALWRQLTMTVFRRSARQPFFHPPGEGLACLREAIAAHIAFSRAVVCQPDHVLVTSGAQQAFDLMARALVTPGKTQVAVENPGYPEAHQAWQGAGATLVPIAVDAEGLVVERLPASVKVIAVTPSHQSPTGVAMSMRRRLALLEFARQHDAVVVEDDYDGEFRYGPGTLDALQTLDQDQRVFYVGTFSKCLFPALRKGFLVAPDWAFQSLAAIKRCSDAHCDALTQQVLAAFIQQGHLARHVRRMQRVYAERRERLIEALTGPLDPWLELLPSQAGLNLAARIRDPALEPRILEAALTCLPGAQSARAYALHRDMDPVLAIGFGVIDAAAIAPAMKQLQAALRRL